MSPVPTPPPVRSGSYVLVTPAHNEERCIEATIRSVVAQELRPAEWIIVNDGSRDRTREIAQRYAKEFGFIRVLDRAVHGGGNTAYKVEAIRAGLRSLDAKDYGYLGNLDADVTMDPTYYRRLLALAMQDDRLGIVGGKVYEMRNGRFKLVRTARDSVAGATQLFRRECFEEIGGYLPLPDGFEDAAAEIIARMKGWKTRSYDELPVLHHRRIGLTGRSLWKARIVNGMNEYRIGYLYPFHLLRALSRSMDQPAIIGCALVQAGYLAAILKGEKKVVNDEVIVYLRKEQYRKLLRLLSFRKMVSRGGERTGRKV